MAGNANTSAAMGRLPKYLAYLKIRQKQGVQTISSVQIATDLRLGPVLVRKDLAIASQAGKPKTGYPLDVLVEDLERYLGCSNAHDAFLIGAGRLGRALLGFSQFADYGLNILAAFDTDERLHGQEIDGKPVFPMQKLSDLVRRMGVNIGILTVPEHAAQACCDWMVECGLRAIWNFTTTTPLEVPQTVIVQSENLAASFATLSKQLTASFHPTYNEGGTDT